MARAFFVILMLGFVSGMAPLQSEAAQEQDGTVAVRSPGAVANLFETVDLGSPVDGFRLQLPDSWQVQELRLLQYGTMPVAAEWRAEGDGTVFLTTEQPVQGPHELVLQVQTGEELGSHAWRLTPFVGADGDAEPDSVRHRQFQTQASIKRRVEVDPIAQPEGANRALDLREAREPLLLSSQSSEALGRSSFTIEFWMQTAGLNEIVLSTWTGEETASYPAEIVVDRGGRLRFYFGQAGNHQALRTKAPVADSRWHHAAVVYDEEAGRLRLTLDGMMVDSMHTSALPVASDPNSLAIGGRHTEQGTEDANERLYSGRLDELRVWPRARPVSTIRRLRTRPFTSPETGEAPFRLSFDEDSGTDGVDWPTGALRMPTSLSFRSPLRNLQAHSEEQSVTLRWQTEGADEGTFVVQRSTDGNSFTDIARLDAPEGPDAPSESQEIVYTDESVPDQVVYYRIRQVNPDQEAERTTGTVKIGLGEVDEDSKIVELIGNFPNPFEESTTVAYRVQEARPLTLTVWDLSGKRVTTLADGMHDPGYYEKTLAADTLPSGTYFVRLNTDRGVQSHRMVVLK